MFNTNDNSTIIYMFFNLAGVAAAYMMLAGSIWYAPVDFSTKGYWAMGILLLTLSLVNVVKYRFDDRSSQDRIKQIEDAKTEKMLKEYVSES
ncbi:MAG: hypothetical protein GY947_18420 [Rhodobacteraceae bacterium]|nr:hypothetical protein [Paracoccaceae bacterium]